jgi:hypothetical protein
MVLDAYQGTPLIPTERDDLRVLCGYPATGPAPTSGLGNGWFEARMNTMTPRELRIMRQHLDLAYSNRLEWAQRLWLCNEIGMPPGPALNPTEPPTLH